MSIDHKISIYMHLYVYLEKHIISLTLFNNIKYDIEIVSHYYSYLL